METQLKPREEYSFDIYVNYLTQILTQVHKFDRNKIELVLSKRLIYFINNNDKMLSTSYTNRIRKGAMRAIDTLCLICEELREIKPIKV